MRVSITVGAGECGCAPGVDDVGSWAWDLRPSDVAILDALTQARYGADAEPLIDGRLSPVVGSAAVQLIADVEAYVATHPSAAEKGARAVVLLAKIQELADHFPLGTWHASPA